MQTEFSGYYTKTIPAALCPISSAVLICDFKGQNWNTVHSMSGHHRDSDFVFSITFRIFFLGKGIDKTYVNQNANIFLCYI